MTQMPQSNRTSETMSQGPPGDAPAPVFRPYVPSAEPGGHSRRPLVFMALSVVVGIVGMVFWSGRPDEAEAKNAKADVSKMTPAQLAEDSSPPAAKELVRRMYHGTDAQRAAASHVVNNVRSPRLRRNLAMAMALETQKRANAMRARTQREMQMSEQGY